MILIENLASIPSHRGLAKQSAPLDAGLSVGCLSFEFGEELR